MVARWAPQGAAIVSRVERIAVGSGAAQGAARANMAGSGSGTAVVIVVFVLVTVASAGEIVAGCRRTETRPGLPAPPAAAPSGESLSGPDTTALEAARLMRGIVDPWTWPRAAGASDRERALEDIGPYEIGERDRGAGPARAGGGQPVNSNADYWSNLVGLAWTRDVNIDFDDEPVDLDADGTPDVRITRHIHAPGGILGNPDLFGLIPTPDDPRGRAGRISISTGVLGLREAARPDGSASGQIGMTCFLCHGGRDPVDGRIVLGLPGSQLDYGLLLATAALLDDTNTEAAAARRARGFPAGRTVRARLLMAGPGRQDLTGEFGLDVTVPGIHSGRYPGTSRVRQGTIGIVNPISVPGILAAAGVDLQNWSGSEVASPRWLRRLIEIGARPAEESLRLLGLPPAGLDAGGAGAGAASFAVADDALRAAASTRRALLLDLRNLGTLGLQQDSFPGLLWADALYDRAQVRPEELVAIPALYGTAAIRRVLGQEAAMAPEPSSGPAAAAAARGRAIFANRTVGMIANRQILKEAPARYAAAKPGGPAHAPILAPIDEALPDVFPVRCADCHSATAGGAPLPIARTKPPFGRCSHCHHAHDSIEPEPSASGNAASASAQGDRHPLSWFNWPSDPAQEIASCTGCHPRHRPFAPVVFSSSLLLPFDADADGIAQDDEEDDARAGGIGTEALLAFDVPRAQRPPAGFAVTLPWLTRIHSVGPTSAARIGVGWVRVAPLLGIRATGPFLHNGSVPTLRALLEPARRRPVTFPLGNAGFVFDTRLPGNRNIGHELGTALSARDKADLIAFLQTL